MVTNNEKVVSKIKMLRDHGSSQKYIHDFIGFNMRMEGLQGAVLGVKLRYLDKWNEKRRQNAARYFELLKDVKQIKMPVILENNQSNFHLFVIRTKKRDELKKFLKDGGVATGIHYPAPIHLQKAYSTFEWEKGDFPTAEKMADEILSLPMFPELKDEQILHVADKIKEFFT